MKKLFLVLMLPWFGCASMPSGSLDPKISHAEIVSDHQLTKVKAFEIADLWVARNFRSAQAVVQLKDKEAGVIVAKGVHPFTSIGMTQEFAEYTLEIRVKDNKIKYTFDVGHLSGHPTYPPKLIVKDMVNKIFPSMVADIDGALKKPADDW